jgi:hypothetical protein
VEVGLLHRAVLSSVMALRSAAPSPKPTPPSTWARTTSGIDRKCRTSTAADDAVDASARRPA